MSMIEDPDIHKTFLTMVSALVVGFVGWFWRRRVGVVDSIEKRVSVLEKEGVTREELKDTVAMIHSDVTGLQKRMDLIYRDMPKRHGDAEAL